MFSVHTKTKSGRLEIPPVWRAPFSWQIRVWTVGLTVDIKLRFHDGLVWTVGLTVDIKLRFRDGLVWTVGLTVETMVGYQIPRT